MEPKFNFTGQDGLMYDGIKSGRYSDTIRIAADIINKEYEPQAIFFLALAYYYMGHYTRARNAFRLLLLKCKAKDEIWNNYALTMLLAGDYSTAERIYENMFAGYPRTLKEVESANAV